MVDVFISYSKSDRALVERLETALNVAGFTTWWDRGLITGDDFGPKIDRQLAEARAVVCLWTESSIKSQWVRAEAVKANAAGKLIPLKTAAVDYDRIPPPFNVLDTGSVEDSARLIEAVKSLLTRPVVEPGKWFLIRARTRQELFSWFGVIGAVLTVSANLHGLVDVARWAKWLLANWLDVVAWFWKTVLFFLPRLTVDDASLLAILLFLSMNIAGCLRRGRTGNSLWETLGSLGLGALIVGSIYWSAFDRVMTSRPGLTGQIFDWLWTSMIAPILGVDTSRVLYPEGSFPKVLAASLVVLAVGLGSVLTVISVTMRRLNCHIDTRVLLIRLMRIAVGVVIIGVLSWGYNLAEKAIAVR
jgi:TIR domain